MEIGLNALNQRDERGQSKFALGCLIVVTGISGVALLGWLSGNLLVAQGGSLFIPMAPSTALIFILLSASWLAFRKQSKANLLGKFAWVGTLFAMLVASDVLSDFLGWPTLNLETFLVRNPGLFGLVPLGRMSPITALTFLFASLSLILLAHPTERFRSLGSVFGVAVFSVGFVVLIGYLFGAPVLYGSTIIPVALPTAVAFVLLGMGLTASGRLTDWPLSSLIGPSVRARLMRPFLIVMVVIIVFYGWFSVNVPSENPALIASLVLFSSLAIASVAISRIAQTVSDQIVAAQEGLRRSVGETAAMVGHDLRNPLQGIAGAAHILKQELSSSSNVTIGQMLDVLQRDVEYSNQIVTDLVDYSGEMKYDLAEISLGSIVEESLKIVNPPNNIQIKNLIRDDKIICDSKKIKRVLINLIENACDAMANGGELTISSRPSGNGVELMVADNGEGMSKDVMESLWKGFFTTKAKGMGLGLAISKRILNGLGGSISVKSAAAEGTIFTIWLPVGTPIERGARS